MPLQTTSLFYFLVDFKRNTVHTFCLIYNTQLLKKLKECMNEPAGSTKTSP